MRPISYHMPYSSQRSPVHAANMVATSQPLAAHAGVRALHQGGNAVDAALAAAITLTVVEPTGNGIGSDAFAIVWDGKQLHGLNASGHSPQAWTPDYFAGAQKMPGRGWDSVTVPGAVAAWAALSKRFGKLPFDQLFKSAIAYARNGFQVSPIIAKQWSQTSGKYRGQPGFDETFLPNGQAPEPGSRFVNAHLARTLERIAETQGDALYRGPLARQLVAHAEAHGGAMTLDDLDAYEVQWCGTISQDFADATVHEIPPNGQGIATLMALGILAHTDIAGHAVDSVDSLHLQIEAMKLAFADTSAFIGDPASMSVDAQELLSAGYLQSRAALIERSKAQTYGSGAPTEGGTVYIAAADEQGMMVSFIQSNYEGFGSGVVVPDTGISLQNRGMGFCLEAGHPNQVGPRKRPFHTIIPGFMTKGGQPLMSFGLMGGPMQAQGHLQLAVRTQLYHQNPQAASDAPRWQITQGLNLIVEHTMPDEIIQGLSQRGHLVKKADSSGAFGFGGAQLIERTREGYIGGSDHRKDGMAVGY